MTPNPHQEAKPTTAACIENLKWFAGKSRRQNREDVARLFEVAIEQLLAAQEMAKALAMPQYLSSYPVISPKEDGENRDYADASEKTLTKWQKAGGGQ